MVDNISYLLALQSIDGLGPIRLKAVLEYFKDPKLAWDAEKQELLEIGIPKRVVELLSETRKKFHPEQYFEELQKSGIKWVTIFDENYPQSLKAIYDPPVVLYYKGELLPEDERAVAIVGTRKMTGYGRVVTEQFTKALANGGFTIVSGLARGVDSAAHWATVNENGRTIAVLGGGLNNIYPPENIKLAEQIILGKGAVVSEFPPSYPSLPGNFPARNRIISGLSKAVLVTEAASDSGSLITARVALEQGRDVYAIPGPITSFLSKGPIDLIRDGARAVSSPEEIFEELGGVMGMQNSELRVKNLAELNESESKIIHLLENDSMHVDEISRQLGIAAGIVAGSLIKMEISGLIRNLGNGVYCKA
jgi:DNA processing protein